jgi:hypothetical protein
MTMRRPMARSVLLASLASVLWLGLPTPTMAVQAPRRDASASPRQHRLSYACYDHAENIVPIMHVKVGPDTSYDLAAVAVLFAAGVREQLVFDLMTECMRAVGDALATEPIADVPHEP